MDISQKYHLLLKQVEKLSTLKIISFIVSRPLFVGGL